MKQQLPVNREHKEYENLSNTPTKAKTTFWNTLIHFQKFNHIYSYKKMSGSFALYWYKTWSLKFYKHFMKDVF